MEKLVSVIMPVHNERKEYLELSIRSICNQTYSNLEFIIIDDASSIECKNNLKEICRKYPDCSIRIINNDVNLGITKSLNKALKQAKGEYIARMDADDFSCIGRIEKQVMYFDQNPQIDIIGTGVVSFGNDCIFISSLSGLSAEEVKCELFFTSTLCHPSVMIRQSFLQKTGLMYDENVNKGQDYELWERASLVGNLMVIPEVLLYYRLHNKQITSLCKNEQNSTLNMVMRRRIYRLGICPTEMEFKCQQSLRGTNFRDISIQNLHDWINKQILANDKMHLVDSETLKKNLYRRLLLQKLKKKDMQCISWVDILILLREIYKKIWSIILLKRHKYIIRKLGLNNGYETKNN